MEKHARIPYRYVRAITIYTGKHPDKKKLIDLFLSQMLDAAVWQAHVLPLSQRIRLFLFMCKGL
jgi:hypothetical protein